MEDRSHLPPSELLPSEDGSLSEDEGGSDLWHSDGVPPALGDALPPRVGRYKILERLGAGGMGEVFLARDERLNRRIALKRIRPDRSGEAELRRRFEVEAHVTARLQHPAIIPVYHYEREKPELFYTMRPVEGMTLHGLLAQLRLNPVETRKTWPVARLIRLFLQAANAVAYAHSRGVIHRDLKPANIIIGRFEEVLVLDWGLAKLQGDPTPEPETEAPDSLEDLEPLAAETRTRHFVGTPSYMAPELFDGSPADERSDVFSLGVILYELLALRPPWRGRSVDELKASMEEPPQIPTAVQPGRRIPAHLAEVALTALALEPKDRYPDVGTFAREVGRALEGRASWRIRSESEDPRAWRLSDGRLREEALFTVFRSRGGGLFRYVCTQRLPESVRVDFDIRLRKGTNELWVWLNTTLDAGGENKRGYGLAVVPGRRRTLSLVRRGRDVAGARSPIFEPQRWYHVSARRERDRVSLDVDGEEIYAYSDPIPLSGGYVALAGRTGGLKIRNLRAYSRGTDVQVSCLAVPDAFFHRSFFEEARVEYETIAASHPGRSEGQLARFRSGLCTLEIFRRETDTDLRALLLEEALGDFTDQERIAGSCLAELGRAIVAGERRDPAGKHEALAGALGGHPDDPYRPVVIEWILSHLHAVDRDDRHTLAELLPLAIEYGMGQWGQRVVSDLVRRVRASWETPPFMSGRGRFTEGDPTRRDEARMFCAFWAGRGALIATTVRELLDEERAQPHHLTDALFALVALGQVDLGDVLLDRARRRLAAEDDERWSRAVTLASVASWSARGEVEPAEQALSRAGGGSTDRAGNAARLGLAWSLHTHGEPARALQVLRPRSPRDLFAFEHLAWFALHDGDPELAEHHLRPLVDRRHHLTGRNLANFLLGTAQIAAGRRDEGFETFALLPPKRWPRTWTLGSYAATKRLGGGTLDTWMSTAFPWERKVLQDHQHLLRRVSDGKIA